MKSTSLAFRTPCPICWLLLHPLQTLLYTFACPHGEMAEWSKARDSKSRNPLKGFEGSNPSLSATYRA
jgi:hypothetical protein